eukprot:SAG22_NODE_3_length_48349_cov_158.681180_7_plen_298_part_00
MFFAVNTSANFTMPRRSVGVSATKVSTRWPQPRPVLTPDDVDDRAWGANTAAAKATNNRTELYGLSAFAYQSQYIGLLWVAQFNGETDGTIEVELASSRDGYRWRRADPDPITGARPKLIPRGPSVWDGMMVHTSTHPLLSPDGRTLQLYYQGNSCSHHGGSCVGGKKSGPAGWAQQQPAVGLATLRSMGWVSLAHSGGGSGSITTTAMARPGPAGAHQAAPKLKVNFAAQAGGSLEAILLDAATGAVVERSAPLTGDELEAAVVWQQREVAGVAVGGVRIEFVLKGDVELFGYLVQ